MSALKPEYPEFAEQLTLARDGLGRHYHSLAWFAVQVPSAQPKDAALLAYLGERLSTSLARSRPEYHVTKVLIAVALIGIQSDKICQWTELPSAAVEMYLDRCRATGLFKDQLCDSGWAQGVKLCEKEEWTAEKAAALFFDIQVVLGNVERRIVEPKKKGRDYYLF